jgi:NAD(P)-dependent dehydrogenase (short-subunit alcohol dehydrogenase family)
MGFESMPSRLGKLITIFQTEAFADLFRYIATDMNIDTRSNEDTTYYDSITKRIPIGKWGDPLDFKGPAIFLASKASSYVSGEILLV